MLKNNNMKVCRGYCHCTMAMMAVLVSPSGGNNSCDKVVPLIKAKEK